MKYEAVSGGSWAGQSESSTRCLDVCKYQMLSNSRRVLWLTLGTSCLQSIQYKFHNKNKTLLAFYTHCMYFYNLYVYWSAIPNLPESAPKLGPHQRLWWVMKGSISFFCWINSSSSSKSFLKALRIAGLVLHLGSIYYIAGSGSSRPDPCWWRGTQSPLPWVGGCRLSSYSPCPT